MAATVVFSETIYNTVSIELNVEGMSKTAWDLEIEKEFEFQDEFHQTNELQLNKESVNFQQSMFEIRSSNLKATIRIQLPPPENLV
ncbi:hypothetical protein KH5_17030 [Urechidicola sp. KH5]